MTKILRKDSDHWNQRQIMMIREWEEKLKIYQEESKDE
jgi:hypothetical protein